MTSNFDVTNSAQTNTNDYPMSLNEIPHENFLRTPLIVMNAIPKF